MREAQGDLLVACCAWSDESRLTHHTPPEPSATTYYIRPDGGSPHQCTGQVDAPYPGSGTGQPCAWDHPFRALPPDGSPRFAGGDTLIIGPGPWIYLPMLLRTN